MGQAGIPLFYLQGMGGGAVLKFRDLFNDGSLYWGWRQYLGETPAGKMGIEALGRYQLNINTGIAGEWNTAESQSPRIFVGINSYPCEVRTRVDTFICAGNGTGGLFIAKDPIGFGAQLYFAIERRSIVGVGDIAVTKDGNGSTPLISIPVATLPLWLRLRIGCSSYRGLNVYFDYSLDGMNWVNIWVENTDNQRFTLNPASVGLYISNYTAHDAVQASFDHFIIKPKSIN